MEKINSSKYWDERFATNWDERRGIEQSRLFTRVFAKLIPDWMKKEFEEKSKGISVCDWGCAEGDGVDELRKLFPKNKYYGIDFSKVAIDTAKKRYGDTGIKFVAVDLLREQYDKTFDMMFASNIFEHFHEPWDVFNKISKYAERYVAILTPYMEDIENEKEHFHTFDLSEYQITRDDFFLVHIDTLDTRLANLGRNPAWVGKQVLAIYARNGVFDNKRLTAFDLTLATHGCSAGETKSKHALDMERLAAKYEKLLSDVREENKELLQAKKDAQDELRKIVTSKRWRAATKVANVVNVVRRKK